MYNFLSADGVHYRVSPDELMAYRAECIDRLPRIEPCADRISNLLWLTAWAFESRYGIAPYEMLQPIIDLEAGERGQGGLKPETPFRRRPLRGLWHKHWFSARFIAANILSAMQREDSAAWVLDVVDGRAILDQVAIQRIAHRFTVTALEDRWRAQQGTGEWLIFIKRPDGNRYLALATHSMDDRAIYKMIVDVCGRDFPDIADWISEAAAAL